jgi:S1-C subfamily serine protease
LKPLVSLALVLLPAAVAWGNPEPGGRSLSGWPAVLGRGAAPQTPHPAVVRVIASEAQGMSMGSGTLVAVNRHCGLVVTNWHVVRDATRTVQVIFPDGFRSAATVLRVDRDWDLAALVIWRPTAEPVTLAQSMPAKGDLLTIAGYGPGSYRAATGRCVQYVSPGERFPYEMVELSAGARQGDSGGPIFNARGELAGVLFGAASGHTTGSYCGRVRWFLAPVIDQFQRADTLLASQPASSAQPSQDDAAAGWVSAGSLAKPGTIGATVRPDLGNPLAAGTAFPAAPPGYIVAPGKPPPQQAVTAAISLPPVGSQPGDARSLPELPPTRPSGVTAAQDGNSPTPRSFGNAVSIALEHTTALDQLKTFLAIVGGVSLLLHGLRALGGQSGK